MSENVWTSIRVRIDMTGTKCDDGMDVDVDSLEEARALVTEFVANRTGDEG